MSTYLYPNRLNQFGEGETQGQVAVISLAEDSFVAETDFGGNQTPPKKYLRGDLIQVGEEEFWQVLHVLPTISTGLKKIRQGDKKPVAEIRKVDAMSGQDWVY